MAEQVTNYVCPACNGTLKFSATSGKLECVFCGSAYEVAEIEALFKEQNEQAAAEMAEKSTSTTSWGEELEGMKVYSCPSCGAELICNDTTAATCCPYCGNQTVIPGQFSGGLKPEYVIPFKTDKEAAKKALLAHYKGKKLLPSSFIAGNHIEDIQGVYVPFWLYDCKAYGHINYDAEKEERRKTETQETITTRYYDVRRSGTIMYEKLPVDASSRMPDGHMDSIEPYDYKEIKPFSAAYMPGFLADKYDVTEVDCRKRMEDRAARTFEIEVEKTVTEYDRHRETSKHINVQKNAVHYAMLPVWLLATKWNNQNFLFAMNGQTGKLVGDLPVDKGKYWKYFALITAIGIGIMLLMNYLVMKMAMNSIKFYLLIIGLPLLIAFLVCGSMKASMKSVTSQTAGNYMTNRGLHLTEKSDIFLRTTTETRQLKSNQK